MKYILLISQLLFFGPLSAATFSYDEAVDGDLVAGIPIQLFQFDVGINTVSGTSGWLQSEGWADWDPFAFSIMPGQQLTLIDLTINTIDGDGNSSVYYTLSDEYGNMLSTFSISDYSGLYISPPMSYPMTAGSYYLRKTSSSSGGEGSLWDYTLSFHVEQVSAVPLPAAVWLFGSGLLGLAGMSRHKKAMTA